MAAPLLTQTQLPMEAILDVFGKQTYLGNSFILPAAGTTLTDNAETPLALIRNPAGSGKSLFLFNRKVATDNNNVLVKFYLNPTPNVLGGATTPLNLRSGSTTASISRCYLGATITSNGTLLEVIPATLSGFPIDFLYILDQGDSLLMTGTQEGSGTTLAIIQNTWYEI